MASRKPSNEHTSLFSKLLADLLNDRENPNSGFKELKPPTLNINQKGEIAGKERVHRRYLIFGEVFLHLAEHKVLRAKIQDLSVSGIGICIDRSVRKYRIGSKVMLEFAPPHQLHGLLIEVELRRVTKEQNGLNHLGFRISYASKWAQKKIVEVIQGLGDPWGP